MRGLIGGIVVIASLSALLATVGLHIDSAAARGPAYGGPQTQVNGPAFFGPAPNPLPYCDNPTYFAPWEENINPVGRLDVGDTATVTTDGMTMDMTIIAEGEPGTQYPGFFPANGEGDPNDRAKGFELAPGDAATIALSQPLFYAQLIFTDVDQPGESFEVVPDWAIAGDVIAYGGDSTFTFEGTTRDRIQIDDLDGAAQSSERVEGRAQVDMLGAVNGFTIRRPLTRIDPDTGEEVQTQGQSGLSVAGGCEASGAAKRVASGPTWNGLSYEVTYELRIRNNMPTAQTIRDVVAEAQAAAQSTFATAEPTNIPLRDLSLRDRLADPAFSAIEVTNLTTTSPDLILNESYDGLADDAILLDGSFLDAESDAVVNMTVRYTPDPARAEWENCTTNHRYLNQSIVEGDIGGIAVSDRSDDGIDPSPSSDNGVGDVDDPTVVLFPCLPAGLEIVKTALEGPQAVCPSFDNGVAGDGVALPVFVGDTVTFCVSVRNTGPGGASNVVVTDSQVPDVFNLGALGSGAQRTVSYDVVVGLDTPAINTATADGDGPTGGLDEVSDTAVIAVSALPEPELEIVKTVLPGPDATCPSFVDGVAGAGAALPVFVGDTVTFCVSVRNTGPGGASNVVVTDAQAQAPFQIGALGSGAQRTVSYDVVVGLDTPAINTATADGDGPTGGLDEVSDTAVIAVSALPEPELEIVKTVLPGPDATCPSFVDGVAGAGAALPVFVGDTVTFCVSVRNTGPGGASNVVVTDAQAQAPFQIGALGSGAQRTVSYDVVVGLDTPAINTATADGDGPTGRLDEVSDTAMIDPRPQPDPVLNVVKTVVRGPAGNCPGYGQAISGLGEALKVEIGDTVTFCVSVRNTGPTEAHNVVISDEQAMRPFQIGTLAPGATQDRSYDVVVKQDTPRLNIAVATGEGPNGEMPPDDDDAHINPASIRLVHTVVRTDRDCDDTVRDVDVLVVDLVGLTVNWCYRITNTGAVPLTNVLLGSPDIGFTSLNALANAGNSFIIGPSGELVRVDVAPLSADGYAVAKAEPARVVLLPGETISVTVTSSIPGGGLASEADVVADPSDAAGQLLGFAPVRDVDEAEVGEGLIKLDKLVARGADADCAGASEVLTVPAGDPVTWCFVVTNVGTLDLRVTEVVDETLNVTVRVPSSLEVLAPAASFTLSVSTRAPGAITNLASVEGTALDDDADAIEQAPIVRDDDTARLRVPLANLTLVKEVSDRGPVAQGAVLTYTLRVTNEGPGIAEGTSVVDVLSAGLTYVSLPSAADWACALDGLDRFRCVKGSAMQPGTAQLLTYTVRLDAGAFGATLVNRATVMSTTDESDTTDNTDDDRTTTRPRVVADPPIERPPDYPGPFSQPNPPPNDPPDEVSPDEVQGLAFTGSTSSSLGLLAAAMVAFGGVMTVGARRSRRRDIRH